jgi:hypothetical protein
LDHIICAFISWIHLDNIVDSLPQALPVYFHQSSKLLILCTVSTAPSAYIHLSHSIILLQSYS